MPAIVFLFAGTARSYGFLAIRFTEKWHTQKVSYIEGTRINHQACFHKNAVGELRFLGSFVAGPNPPRPPLVITSDFTIVF